MTTTANECPYTLTGIKNFRGREGYGLNAYLICDGRKIAEAIDSSNGGMMDIRWLAKTQEERSSDESAVKAYVATLPKWGDGWDHDAESFINKLADDVQTERDVKRKLSSSVLLIIPGRKGIQSIPKFKPTPENLALACKRYPEAVILNNLPLQEVVAAFREAA